MRWPWHRWAVLAALTAGTVGRAQEFQSWNEVDLSAAWKRASVLVPFVARTDASLANPQLAATGVMVDVPLVKHLVATGGYLFVDLPQSVGGVQVPLLAATAELRVRRVEISDRNRFEKLYGYGSAPVRYRNRVMADWRLDRKERWHGFVDDEMFWNVSNDTWNQNRLQVGVGAWFSRRVGLDLYYLQKNPAGSAAMYVVGTDLRVVWRGR